MDLPPVKHLTLSAPRRRHQTAATVAPSPNGPNGGAVTKRWQRWPGAVGLVGSAGAGAPHPTISDDQLFFWTNRRRPSHR
jgi:hypothetical protein